ncbi:hypothetical protein OAO87_04195 [bacterium]|nr:hypothetical protein [bacterium]
MTRADAAAYARRATAVAGAFSTQRHTGIGSVGKSAAKARCVYAIIDAPALNRTLRWAGKCGCLDSPRDSGGCCFGAERCAGMGSAGNVTAEARHANATLDALAFNHALLWAAQARLMCADAAAHDTSGWCFSTQGCAG